MRSNLVKNKQTLIIIGVSIVVLLVLLKSCNFFNSSLDNHSTFNTDVEDHTKHQESESANHEEDENYQPIISLSTEELEEFEIDIDIAGSGYLEIHRDLAGEIVIDPKRLAHIGPRFPGIVTEVKKQLGDRVNKDEVVAIIESNESLTTYQVRSLISGTIIEMHLTRGEMVSDSDHDFIVADLSEVWINLSVYQKDLPYIKLGQAAEINTGHKQSTVTGIISYISPIVDEQTRTATARVILKNPDGLLKPGLFVSAKVIVEKIDVNIVIPKTALQTIDGKPTIFIKTHEGFKPVNVHLGRSNEYKVEILSGILPGQEYVSKGGFTLKAELAKGSLSAGHAH